LNKNLEITLSLERRRNHVLDDSKMRTMIQKLEGKRLKEKLKINRRKPCQGLKF
jgi:hypothetical protein